jgi:uncharacterized hydrophobic protein (TIGR00271 family)
VRPRGYAPRVIHLRIVTPADHTEAALDVLERSDSVCNIVTLPGAARRPQGDVLLADVAREDASVVISELRALGIHKDGAISIDPIDTQLSDRADRAIEHAKGAPADAVVWEEVEARTNEQVELSAVYVAFMVLAALLAMVGIYQDSAILIVGAMVVGPEFGPLAGLCVALIHLRGRLALRSGVALVVGFPLAIGSVYLATLLFKAVDLFDDDFSQEGHGLSNLIAAPDFFTFFVAVCAGAAGMLSLSTAKSGALIGVLISVTTIPAAANIGLTAAYQDWDSWRGSVEQLVINLGSIVLAGTAVLYVQRLLYLRRKAELRPRSRARTRSRPSSSPSRPPRP